MQRLPNCAATLMLSHHLFTATTMRRFFALTAGLLALTAGSASAQYTYSPSYGGGYSVNGPSGSTQYRPSPSPGGGYTYSGPNGSGTLRPAPQSGRVIHGVPSNYNPNGPYGY